jgi:hypothetical protein
MWEREHVLVFRYDDWDPMRRSDGTDVGVSRTSS